MRCMVSKQSWAGEFMIYERERPRDHPYTLSLKSRKGTTLSFPHSPQPAVSRLHALSQDWPDCFWSSAPPGQTFSGRYLLCLSSQPCRPSSPNPSVLGPVGSVREEGRRNKCMRSSFSSSQTSDKATCPEDQHSQEHLQPYREGAFFQVQPSTRGRENHS